jgi:tetratricopeptide (TPR) repeat protein
MRASPSTAHRPSRSALALAALLAIPLSTSIASAQAALELPQPSPRARAEQRVGVTDFSIEYSSPAVKGRKIWGDLVPHGKVWRAGANAATKLTASRDFSFGGTAVKAGAYSIFVTPVAKGQWTVHLNSDPNAPANEHDPKKDVAKVNVAPQALAAPRERLIYVWNDTQDDRTSLELEWERVRIRMPITVDTKAHVTAAIEKATGEAWRPHAGAASYYFNAGDHDRALAMVDKSIAIQATWRNEWLRAQILGKKGKKADATAAANRALTLGKDDPVFEQFIKADVNKAIAGWK